MTSSAVSLGTVGISFTEIFIVKSSMFHINLRGDTKGIVIRFYINCVFCV